MDDGGPGCLAVLAGLSVSVYVVLTFGYFRHGFEDIGVGGTGSWVLALLGSGLLVAAVVGVGPVVRADLGCLPVLGYFAVWVALLVGHYLVLRRGDPPAWVLDPPTPVEWVWDDPPRWAEITQWVVGTVVGLLVTVGAAGRRR